MLAPNSITAFSKLCFLEEYLAFILDDDVSGACWSLSLMIVTGFVVMTVGELMSFISSSFKVSSMCDGKLIVAISISSAMLRADALALVIGSSGMLGKGSGLLSTMLWFDGREDVDGEISLFEDSNIESLTIVGALLIFASLENSQLRYKRE